MPYNGNQIPDAPLPISLLPSVEIPTSDDLLLVTQPGQPQGHRSRSMTLRQVANHVMPDGGVTTNKLASGAVTTEKLATRAITTDKLDYGAVKNEQLDNQSVNLDKIAYSARTDIMEATTETSVVFASSDDHNLLASFTARAGSAYDFSVGFTAYIPQGTDTTSHGYKIVVKSGTWTSGETLKSVYVATGTPGSALARMTLRATSSGTIRIFVVKATTSDGPVASPTYFNLNNITLEGIQYGLDVPTP